MIYFLLILMFCQPIRPEIGPKFCQTLIFDGIYQLGSELKVRATNGSSHWVWTYNPIAQAFNEPPNLETDERTVVTGVYIPDVPKCKHSYEYCQQMLKAIRLGFVLSLNHMTKDLDTKVIRTTLWNTTGNVEHRHYPWNLTLDSISNIWPKEWQNFDPRPSVFWPERFEVIYLINSGVSDSSALLWNDISTINWFENMKKHKLNSNVHFVGLFHLAEHVLAAGQPLGSNETFVFRMTSETDSRDLTNTDKSFREYFGCYRMNVFFPTLSSARTPSTRTPAPNDSKDSDSNSVLIFILVIVIFSVFLIVLLSIIIYVSLKSQGTVTTTEKLAMSIGSDYTPQSAEKSRTSSVHNVSSMSKSDRSSIPKPKVSEFKRH